MQSTQVMSVVLSNSCCVLWPKALLVAEGNTRKDIAGNTYMESRLKVLPPRF